VPTVTGAFPDSKYTVCGGRWRAPEGPRTRGNNRRAAGRAGASRKETTMGLVLWIIAAILVISGIVSLVRGQLLMGAALIVVGLLVGPGGVSIFT
jgi:hypothetical protein